jgi:Spy/CpxP family protein refolding chaperone
MNRSIYAWCALTLGTTPLVAQTDHHHSPYADQAKSGIASLSVPELDDLRNGAGMGFARAAELNHYPGPKHVLELSDSLNLTNEQAVRIMEIFQTMDAQARAIGEQVIEAERLLSTRFAHAHIDSTAVQWTTATIGRLLGELRYVHLAAHLAVTGVLTAQQVATYDRIRGYVQPG